MKIADVLKLTNVSNSTLYRWMEKHPTMESPLGDRWTGRPFPRPKKKKKEGRVVVWDEKEVLEWWDANASTISKHPNESPSILMDYQDYRTALDCKKEKRFDEELDRFVYEDDFRLIWRTEFEGDDVRLWFRHKTDQIKFMLRFC